MIELLGKVDAILLAVIGGVGWVLQDNSQDAAAILLAGGSIVVGVAGAVGGLAVWKGGGHQAPALAAGLGHFAPSLARAAVLIGLAWVGAWAAAEAGVEAEGAAAAISVVVFGVFADLVKPVKEKLDELRPTAFGQKAIRSRYGSSFTAGAAIDEANAFQAVHNDRAELHDAAGVRVRDIGGWKLDARQQRLEVIAEAMR